MDINWLKFFFYCYAAVALFGATMVILSRNSVRAVLFLVLTFVAASGMWMLLQAEFLALVLILVYVGAVMVLFLFVVMMLNMNLSPLREGFVRYLPIGLLIAAALVAQLIFVYKKTDMVALHLGELAMKPADYSNITELGLALYSDYLYPFEIAGVILLVAIVAAIALTFRGPQNRRRQNIAEQVATQKSDRLRVLKDISPDSDLKA
jgi:NADH-quinone oxidoreductase subunit J